LGVEKRQKTILFEIRLFISHYNKGFEKYLKNIMIDILIYCYCPIVRKLTNAFLKRSFVKYRKRDLLEEVSSFFRPSAISATFKIS